MKMDIEQGLKIRTFDANKYMKYTLANSFYIDSNDFLDGANILLKHKIKIKQSFLAKIFVDLLLSSECSLKSLIISLSSSGETPEESYAIARKKKHNLMKLYEEVEIRSRKRLLLLDSQDKEIIFNAFKLDISHRYNIVTLLSLMKESLPERIFKTGKVSSIINITFIERFYKTVESLNKIALKSRAKYFKYHDYFDGKDALIASNRFRTFLKNRKDKF